MSEDAVDQAGYPSSTGERLRAAREAAGLSLADVGARTRVPQRHLEAIETDDFVALPSATYAVGFARAYARAVGIDEVAVARDVRATMGSAPRPSAPEFKPYQIEEPRRVAPRGVVIGGIVIVLLILAGVALWYSGSFGGGANPSIPAPAESAAPVNQAVPQAAPTHAAPAATANGQVTLTATDEVWVRIYDADNKTLLIKTLQPGETYSVPQDANRPMINVGRPEKLNVTINGVAVPPLGAPAHAIKNVGISAAALTARDRSAAPAAGATPAAGPSVPAAFQGGNAAP